MALKADVALVVLACNEEPFLEECYRHHAPYVDFTICVVSKSQDRTEEIAKRNFDLVEVVDFPGSFGKLREHANDISPCRWVLHVDADERFPTAQLSNIRRLAEKLPLATALGFPRVNPSYPQPWPDYQFRLMRKETRYIGRVHEEPLGPKRQLRAIPENAIIHLNPPARIYAKIPRWRSLGEEDWRTEQQQIQALEDAIDSLTKSISWRITAPVRLLGSVLLTLQGTDLLSKIKPATNRFACIQSNPLATLQNPNVRDLFKQLVQERLNNDLLSSYYKLGDRVDSYDIARHRVSRAELATKIVDFLTIFPENDPIIAAQAFWKQFSFRSKGNAGVPPEIDSIEAAYGMICQEAAGLVMIHDMLKQSNLPNGRIIDVGCRSNDFNVAILAEADQRGLRIQKAIGTDIVQMALQRDDPRLEFRKQSSTKTLPIDSEYADLLFSKWSLHHMTLDEIGAIVHEISRILKLGGKAIVIEALMGQDLYRGFRAESRQKETWPQGPWEKTRRTITKRYLRLPLDQQKAVLALEDYYGYWLESRRINMPLPFTYLTPAEFGKHFEAAGMKELVHLRRIFGYAPIIHQGPPSVRLVYEKRTRTFSRSTQ